jgi:hypothetical protein
MIVQYLEETHREESLSYRELCEREEVPYASFMRWRKRLEAGQCPVSRPGPSKVEHPDLQALREEIRLLDHGRKRSAGTGELHTKYQDAISRRDFNLLVKEERDHQKRERNRVFQQVNWKVPRLIWAMDDAEFRPDFRYPKAYLHTVQDLGSRFRLTPLVGLHLAHGEQIADNLRRLFDDHGAPLFLKRDNGSNLNHHLVDELLEEYIVIPVNSPCQYPQYNGGVERAQREIKSALKEHEEHPAGFLAIQAEIDVDAMNHRKRSVLHNRTACAVFSSGEEEARKYTKRKRKEAYDWIREKTLELITSQAYNQDKAWRMTVEIWLLEHRFITVSKRK